MTGDARAQPPWHRLRDALERTRSALPEPDEVLTSLIDKLIETLEALDEANEERRRQEQSRTLQPAQPNAVPPSVSLLADLLDAPLPDGPDDPTPPAESARALLLQAFASDQRRTGALMAALGEAIEDLVGQIDQGERTGADLPEWTRLDELRWH